VKFSWRRFFSRGKSPSGCNSAQGCQMVYFQTKSTNLGKFYRALDWRYIDILYIIWDILYGHLEYFTDIGIVYDHLVHFVFVCNISSRFGIMYPKKSGNPDSASKQNGKGKLLISRDLNFLPLLKTSSFLTPLRHISLSKIW
jgi:hypothetical protein